MTSVDLAARQRQLILELPVRARMTEGDFMPAGCNEAALGAIFAWPEWPSRAILIHGPAGAGKTHLLEIWRARAGAVSLGPEMFSGPIEALRAIEGAAVVAVDDADRIGDERGLLHLYNMLGERSGSLLLTASRPLGDWVPVLPDLRSRLMTAWQVAIGPPDEVLLAALVVKQLADRQLKVEPGVVEYAVARMERSFAMARVVVEALDRYSLGQRRPIGIGLARSILAAFGAKEESDEQGTEQRESG